jgi:DeoR/GlpR family transcriptional regulator of sugar metabolism
MIQADPAASQGLPAEAGGRNELHISNRRNRIVQMVNQGGQVRVAELSNLFGISEVTIRNDLTELERLDMLERVHGGAVRTNRSYYRLTIQERLATNKSEKMAIADHVRSLVHEGDTLFLNSGTTTIYVARAIRDIRNLLIVTNSPLVAQETASSDGSETILIGGSYHGPMAFTYGDDAVKQIAKYRGGKFFLTCDGISAAAGIMTYNTHEVEVNRRFIENSAMTICVADFSKIGRFSRISIGMPDCLDALVTNAKANQAELDAIRALGVDVRLTE